MEGAGWVEVGIPPGGRRRNAFGEAGDGGARERVRGVLRVRFGECRWCGSQRALRESGGEECRAGDAVENAAARMRRTCREAGGSVGGEGVRGFGLAPAGMPTVFSRCLNVPNGRIQGVSPLGCTS